MKPAFKKIVKLDLHVLSVNSAGVPHKLEPPEGAVIINLNFVFFMLKFEDLFNPCIPPICPYSLNFSPFLHATTTNLSVSKWDFVENITTK